FPSAIDRNNAYSLGGLAQTRVIEQILDRLWNPPVTIFSLGANGRERLFIARGRNPFVGPQPLAHVSDIAFRNCHIDPEINRNGWLVFDLLAAQFSHGALEHLRVKVEPKRVHVARLLAAKQVTRTPQFQIEGGDAKAGAQIRKLPDGC